MTHTVCSALRCVAGLVLGTALVGPDLARADIVDLIVPVRTIRTNEIVQPGDLVKHSFQLGPDAPKLWVDDARMIEGKAARRLLVARKPIPFSALKDPDAVKRGVPVTATYAVDGLVISTLLIPQQDAAAGEAVEARNPQTGKLVEARVTAHGELEVLAP